MLLALNPYTRVVEYPTIVHRPGSACNHIVKLELGAGDRLNIQREHSIAFKVHFRVVTAGALYPHVGAVNAAGHTREFGELV